MGSLAMSKLLKITTALFLLYTLFGFFVLPKLLLPKLQKIANENLNGTLSVESLYINPLTFTTRLSGINLADTKEKKLLHLSYAELDLDPTALLFGTVVVNGLYLDKPDVAVAIEKDGTLNFEKLLKQSSADTNETESQEASKLPHFCLNSFKLNEGMISFEDHSKAEPFVIDLHQLFVELRDVDSQNLKEGRFHLTTKVAQSGHVEIFSNIKRVEPLTLEGSFGFEIDELSKEFAYIKDQLNMHISQGKASFFTKYSVDTNNTDASELSHMNFSLYDLKGVANESNATLFHLEYLYINDITLKPFKERLHIPYAGIKGLFVNLQRKSDGSIDWMHYLKLDKSTKSSDANSSSATTQKPWHVLVDNLALDNVNVTFDDHYITPSVTSKVEKLSLHMQHITLLGEEPLSYELAFHLNKNAACELKGAVVHKQLDLSSEVLCKDIDITHYRPYIDNAARENLKKYNLLLAKLGVDAKINLQLYQEQKEYFVKLNNTQIKFNDLLLQKRTTNKKLLSLDSILLDGITLDTKANEASVALLQLSNPRVWVRRYKNGALNLESVVEPKAAKKEAKSAAKKQKSMHFVLKEFALQNARVDFYDNTLNQSVHKRVQKINIQATNIDTAAKSWLHYKASMQLNSAKLALNGKVRHTPLKQSGKVVLKDLAIAEINPYLQEESYVKIAKGKLSFDLSESYLPSKKRADLSLRGSFAIDEFMAQDEHDGNADLLGVKKLSIKPLTLELSPNRLYIDTVLLNGLYVAAKVDENKSFNFAELMKEDKKQPKDTEKKEKKKSSKKEDAFAFKIAKVAIEDSKALFRDFSIPIKFQTNIHNLHGTVLDIANQEAQKSIVDIDGEIDAYGATKISGSLDSFDPKRFTDMQLAFKNLDLSSMSGYSASFAGYKIAAGKLFLDLAYEINNAKLHASNNIVIKQIKLGEELEGEGINHLPLGFVLALLEDSNGVIDIDLPIEGDLDAPDFKYGTIVWNTLTNLIAKAVSSPFRFLGAMLGIDADKLQNLEFAYAKADIAPPQREKLDSVAKIMKKRPKILLSVTPVYDEVADKKALQEKKLSEVLIQKSGDANVLQGVNALTIEMLEEIYTSQRDDDTLDLLQERLEKEYKEEDAYKRAYQDALIKLCSELQPVSKEELKALARARAAAVKNYLMKKGVVLTRVVVKSIESVRNEAKEGVSMPLSIDVQSSDK
jgi:uncharacterized protein involved in outer membrane biogenesis